MKLPRRKFLHLAAGAAALPGVSLPEARKHLVSPLPEVQKHGPHPVARIQRQAWRKLVSGRSEKGC
jgi:hypothetical protein